MKKPTNPKPSKYIRISQELHTELKVQCVLRGCLMQSLVERLVRHELVFFAKNGNICSTLPKEKP